MQNLKIKSAFSRKTCFKNSLLDDSSDYLLRDDFLRTRLRLLTQSSPFSNSILISGPAGCGKSSFAYQMWKHSNDVKRPFINVDCDTIETEKDLQNLFRQASFGDLFLRNIIELNSRLLSELESLSSTSKNVRLIASTREYYGKYASVFSTSISIPPLRKRKEDIRHIVLALLNRRGGMSCSASAMHVFLEEEWKHEFLELADCVYKCVWFARREHRICVTREDVLKSLSYAHINFWHFETFSSSLVRRNLSEKGLKNFLQEIEAMAIAMGLVETDGNFSKLARRLQIPVTTLLSRCKGLKQQIADLCELMMG